MNFFKRSFVSAFLLFSIHSTSFCTGQMVQRVQGMSDNETREVLDSEYKQLQKAKAVLDIESIKKLYMSTKFDVDPYGDEFREKFNTNGSSSLRNGIAFFLKLNARYNGLANIDISFDRLDTNACCSMLDWIATKNKNIEYLVQLPYIVEKFLSELKMHEDKSVTKMFLIKIADFLSLNFFLEHDLFGVFDENRYKKPGEEVTDKDMIDMFVILHKFVFTCAEALDTIYSHPSTKSFIREYECAYEDGFIHSYGYQYYKKILTQAKRQGFKFKFKIKTTINIYKSPIKKSNLNEKIVINGV